MTTVYVVQHAYEPVDGVAEVKLIGIYTTKDRAAEAIGRLCLQPGFSQQPDGFHVDGYELDVTSWAEGFSREEA